MPPKHSSAMRRAGALYSKESRYFAFSLYSSNTVYEIKPSYLSADYSGEI